MAWPPNLTPAEWLIVLVLLVSVVVGGFGIYFKKQMDKNRKPKLNVKVLECNHGHPTKNHPSFIIRPKVLINNVGEQATSIYRVEVEGISEISKIRLSPENIDVESPLRIDSKGTQHFKKESLLKGELSEENYYLHFTFYFSEGSSQSNTFLSKYHEII